MAWPPLLPPQGRSNTTPQLTNHPDDHNRTAVALAELVAAVGAGPQVQRVGRLAGPFAVPAGNNALFVGSTLEVSFGNVAVGMAGLWVWTFYKPANPLGGFFAGLATHTGTIVIPPGQGYYVTANAEELMVTAWVPFTVPAGIAGTVRLVPYTAKTSPNPATVGSADLPMTSTVVLAPGAT